jgi:hypothetical protein
MALIQNNVTVPTVATLICTLPSGTHANTTVYVDNLDSAPIWIGDATITSSGATQGIKINAGGSRQLWMNGSDQLYAVSAAGTGAGLVVVTYSA